jgi:hypothetical protein
MRIYDIVYDIVYDMTSHSFIQPLLLPSDGASKFQLPCALFSNALPAHLLCNLDRNRSWKCPPVVPHPDLDLEKLAARPAVLPGISSSASRKLVSKAVRNSIVKISLEVAREEGDNDFHRADIECWELGGSPFINHRDTIPLHAAVWGERYRLKCAEEYQ